MAATRRVIEVSVGEEDLAQLEAIARSRIAPASWVERARIPLAYQSDPSTYAVGEAVGVTHQTVKRCLDRAVRLGVLTALDDSPRPGKAWLVSLACQKANDLGYPHERWTTRLLARHAREHAEAEGHPCLANLAQGTVCKILARNDVKPHKVRYYLENAVLARLDQQQVLEEQTLGIKSPAIRPDRHHGSPGRGAVPLRSRIAPSSRFAARKRGGRSTAPCWRSARP